MFQQYFIHYISAFILQLLWLLKVKQFKQHNILIEHMKIQKISDRGYSYNGQILDNYPHGEGTQKFLNEDKYTGKFNHGQRDGNGKYEWKNGIFLSYQGKFKQNTMSGEGTIKLRTGQTITGEFECENNFTIKTANFEIQGSKYKGNIENGEFRKDFSIQKKNTKIFNIKIQNLNRLGTIIEQNNNKYQLFEDKKLIQVDNKVNPDELKLILKQVQKSYENASKHSEALKILSKKLQKYNCQLGKENFKDAIVVIPICGRQIVVKKKQVKQ